MMHDEDKKKFAAVIAFYDKLIPRLLDYAASFTFDGTQGRWCQALIN